MSTIDERITQHETHMKNAKRMFLKYDVLRTKWDDKYRFHQNAISNLNVKKAKQENKEIR